MAGVSLKIRTSIQLLLPSCSTRALASLVRSQLTLQHVLLILLLLLNVHLRHDLFLLERRDSLVIFVCPFCNFLVRDGHARVKLNVS